MTFKNISQTRRLAILAASLVALSLAAPASATSSPVIPAPLIYSLTHVPSSAFAKVGVHSSSQVYAPVHAKNQPVLTASTTKGALPDVLYVGGEFCPYCAAERWPLVVALSRFGSFKGLSPMSSASTDVYPSTPTVSFYHSSYTSKYIVFSPVEIYANYLNKKKTAWANLETLTRRQARTLATYDSSKYFPGVSATSPPIPFVDLGNAYLIVGSSFTPQVLHGLTRSQIIASLAKPKTASAYAILATANYLTASICSLTHQLPATVCKSAPVKIAALVLKK